MTRPLLSRLTGWFLLTGAFAASVASVFSQATEPAAPAEDPVPLERYVVSATRSAQDPRATPSAVTLLDLPELNATQVPDLRTALAQQPGVAVVSTGAPGGQTSVFLRGANAHQTLFVVDGVRMNDRSASYINFLGAADYAGFDRIEVLRGPQSTLYGSSAMGGVVLMETSRGCGPVTGRVAAHAGSFDTWGAAAAVSGGTRTLGYSAAWSQLDTENDRPANAFRQWSASGRLEFAPDDRWLVGATFRRLEADAQEPGSRFFPTPGAHVDSGNTLATAYAEVRAGEAFRSRLTLAQHERDYRFADEWFTSELHNRRRVLDWLNAWRISEPVELVAGANYERSRFRVNGAPTFDRVAAAHASVTARPAPGITMTGGLRRDDFRSVGAATTWRSGVSWQALPATRLRATLGTGFGAPGSEDRFGVPAWGQLPNPELRPEKSRGWDVGVDQQLGDRLTVAATYFRNTFRDLFDWETTDFTTYAGRTINRARASSEGLELAVAAQPWEAVRLRLASTWLDARDAATDARLVRRPRHTLDGDVRVQLAAGWTVGGGARFVGGRLDAAGLMEDYATARVFAAWAVRPNLELKLRLENALEEAYEEVLGYPALPRAAYGSVDWTF